MMMSMTAIATEKFIKQKKKGDKRAACQCFAMK